MPEIDYPAIKEMAAKNHEKVFDFLGLQMKRTHPNQFRGPDPVCGRGGDRILVFSIQEQRWCCHSSVCSPKGQRAKGGDLIYLTAHIRGIKQSEAAKLLQQHFMSEPEKPKKRTRRKPAPSVHNRQPPVGATDDAYSIVDYLEQFS